MKKNELSEFKKKPVEELSKELESLMQKKLELTVAVVSGKEKNLRVLKNIRRNIAQISTIKGIIERQEEGEKARL